ncbi:MAG TPA: M20/M25/M40 family metallo-hydrolase [Gemmatimonadales bacterium]|nr:M20/M25/M40 family metallo-hydrolase [Gemmatimonadales bacterium]
MRLIRPLALSALAVALTAVVAGAQVVQEKVDLGLAQRLRSEEFSHSQIAEMGEYLFDVIGPRLTGSSGMRKANEWTADQLKRWGLANVTVEPWGTFGRGWERVNYYGMILTPWVQPLNAEQLAWSGSTHGTVTGRVVAVDIADSTGLDSLRAMHGKLKNAFVLLGTPRTIEPMWQKVATRFDPDIFFDTTQQPREGRAARRPEDIAKLIAMYRARLATRDSAVRELQHEGAAAVLLESRRNYTLLDPQGGPNREFGADTGKTPDPNPIPALTVGEEQYDQMWRDVRRGVPVTIKADIQNKFLTDDPKAYNTLGEIPGSDLKDQYVMIGAHLDSWFGGSGATDNGAGTLVMMEAMRLLKQLNLQPRRTIRIGLWSGEEQGLLGSRGWVKDHPEMLPKISAYLNLDNGTGKIRGIWDQMNDQVDPIFAELLIPFRDLGVVGVRHGNTGGTDHLSFDAAGVPGFNFIQDPIDYGTETHHTTADTFDRLQIADLEQAAVVVAYTAYELAMRDEMMPRKQQAEMGASRR